MTHQIAYALAVPSHEPTAVSSVNSPGGDW